MQHSGSSYGKSILSAHQYLLSNYQEVFILGQGLWSPWYVGNSMTGLDKEFGKERIIDSPVSEAACTGVAVGAALYGYRPIMVHPRMDFMLYAVDAIVNQAAKWSPMLGGQAHSAVTIRSIINRGGEQGAQHSQSFHAWFAHIPGLRVVMPATPQDARDLLIASVLCDDPVLYIDDRWLYEVEQELPPIVEMELRKEGPKIIKPGTDITLVGNSYSTHLCQQAAEILEFQKVSCEVIDLRVINPFQSDLIIHSVQKTGALCVVDGSWSCCGLAGEVIAQVVEKMNPSSLKKSPCRITLPDAPAPTSRALEVAYYPDVQQIIDTIMQMIEKK
ncbi:MAG: alpha-ketoacid dehydrogenase subunit beta [SAR324 cluster bacterium]|nr:alpha-ketoacid dehydrogenase subunit beta [SAR324 cluster bacterium]